MKKGKAFEIFVKRILMNIGFYDVESDGLYIFDGAPGQMIQGLGDAHNADVLLEPPVQTPFYSKSRLLIECKDYQKSVGLGVIRSILGLREDINNFEIVDIKVLAERRHQKRSQISYDYERFTYQVAVASMSGFTVPAQQFAATHRIPLLQFDKLPFWEDFRNIILNANSCNDEDTEQQIENLANDVGQDMAVAITNSGQILFLYHISGERKNFDEFYSLYWNENDLFWQLVTGDDIYLFQLPDRLMKKWLENTSTDLEMKEKAIACKASYLSNMIVYYSEYGLPKIKMISIDKYALQAAKNNIEKEKYLED